MTIKCFHRHCLTPADGNLVRSQAGVCQPISQTEGGRSEGLPKCPQNTLLKGNTAGMLSCRKPLDNCASLLLETCTFLKSCRKRKCAISTSKVTSSIQVAEAGAQKGHIMSPGEIRVRAREGRLGKLRAPSGAEQRPLNLNPRQQVVWNQAL